MGSGAPNEIWEFGDEAYPILEKYLHMRERLKPYIREMMKAAHETGAPLMRPLFYDFPGDAQAWKTEDAYMFGPDLLVAPIFEADATERAVYLPANAKWIDAETGREYAGGQIVTVPAPLDVIPVFLKNGIKLPVKK